MWLLKVKFCSFSKLMSAVIALAIGCGNTWAQVSSPSGMGAVQQAISPVSPGLTPTIAAPAIPTANSANLPSQLGQSGRPASIPNLPIESSKTNSAILPSDIGQAKNGSTSETSVADPNIESNSEAKNNTKSLSVESLDDTVVNETEFQRFVFNSTGQKLKLYGYELFANSDNFGSVQSAPVPAGYILGPGDEIVVQVLGLADFSERLVIDRDGRVQVPKVGPLNLAGVKLSDAEKVFSAHIGKIFRNFTVSVTMGRLRSIEVFIVGQARKPGKHTVSSMSSLINTVFQTGGPSSNGSLRAVELRRAGKKIATLDLYDFLARGDNSTDTQLLAGDVVFIPPAGPRAALLGTVNAQAIYELRGEETIKDILALSGGLPILAAPQKAQLERVDAQRDIARYVQDFALDVNGLAQLLKAGDILTVFQISPQIDNVITLQGNVAAPLRYNFTPGMRVADLLNDKRLLIPGNYWEQINRGIISGNYSRPEVNLDYATVQRLDPLTLRTELISFDLLKAMARQTTENIELVSGDIVTIYGANDAGPETVTSLAVQGNGIAGMRRLIWRDGYAFSDIAQRVTQLINEASRLKPPSVNQFVGEGYSSADLNLDFATLTRRIPETQRSKILAFNLGKALAGDSSEPIALQSRDTITLFGPKEPGPETENSITITGEVVGGTRRFVWRPGFAIKDIIPDARWLVDQYNFWQRPGIGNLISDINWDYAQIIRRVPDNLSTELVVFNLGNAVLRASPEDNILLKPGDKIALFTTAQKPVPLHKRLQIVSLSGEVNVPGNYQLENGDTLLTLIARAGGLSRDAFPYGTVFTRESTRREQQANLEKATRRLEQDINDQVATQLQNVTDGEQGNSVQAQIAGQKVLLSRLQGLRASGRIALEMDAQAPQIPALTLEGGDTINVPQRPSFVGVFGAVQAETSFIFRPDADVAHYIERAGPTRDADLSSAFLIRADGSAVANNANRSWIGRGNSSFMTSKLNPGDSVFVPEVLDRRSAYTQFIQAAKDWTVLFYQFGLGAAAIRTLQN